MTKSIIHLTNHHQRKEKLTRVRRNGKQKDGRRKSTKHNVEIKKKN